MSDNVKITAAFDGPSGYRYSGLHRVEVAGDAAVAVEAMGVQVRDPDPTPTPPAAPGEE